MGKKVEDYNAQHCPQTPPREEIQLTVRTPHTMKDVIRGATRIQNIMDVLSFEDIKPSNLQSFIKGCLAQAHESQILERDLTAIQTAAVAKATRKKLPNTVAQKGGVVTADSVRWKRAKKEEDAMQKARTALLHAQRAVEREENRFDTSMQKVYKQLGKEVRTWIKARNDLRKKQKHIVVEIRKSIAFRR